MQCMETSFCLADLFPLYSDPIAELRVREMFEVIRGFINSRNLVRNNENIALVNSL
jgi:hypothetical protein